MKTAIKTLQALVVAAALASLSGCDDPHVYGSVGISSGYGGYGGYGGWGGTGVRTSISVGGRIR
ncbi:MAG: hypothetical protein AAGI11_19655 [Pseudomonadota bacterium]